MKKSNIEVLQSIIELNLIDREFAVKEISNAHGCSNAWICRILNELCEQDFVQRHKRSVYSLNKKRITEAVELTKSYLIMDNYAKKKIENTIRILLHSCRNVMRIRVVDTTEISYDMRNESYCEAFGIMKGVKALGYGYFGSSNLDGSQEFRRLKPEHNLKWWFEKIATSVLEEEGFYSHTNECDYCLEHYGEDGAGRLR